MNQANKILKLFYILLIFAFCETSFAVTPAEVVKSALPGSVEPGVITQNLPAQEPQQKHAGGGIAAPSESKPSLGPQAAKIKFKLNKIILEDNHVFTEQQLLPIYKDKIGKTITVTELQDIVLNIGNYYRNNGYILSRAILPPQHVANGIVHVRVIEGYVEQVRIVGNGKGSEKLLRRFGRNISKARPATIDSMEYNLRLMNEIPGVQVRAVLEPSKTATGASDLNLATDASRFFGYVQYDTYGTRYIGPQQITLSGNANSIFTSGDTVHIIYLTTPRPLELKYVDLSHEIPLNAKGLRFGYGHNEALSVPEFVLRPLKIYSKALTYYGYFKFPWIRSRTKNLSFEVDMNYLDSGVNSFGFPIYLDHLRTVKFGGSFDFTDSYKGSNLILGSFTKGLKYFGASTNPTATNTSRFGATGDYLKFNLQLSRVQYLKNTRFSVFVMGRGQYSCEPLLSSEQFTWGGSQLGRGYDPAELIGDLGAGGTIEARFDSSPGWRFFQSSQLYTFYDFGAIWNRKNVVGTLRKQSATSIGGGMRMNFTNFLSGNLMIGQPLTKQVAAEGLIGNGRLPRVFFNITATMS